MARGAYSNTEVPTGTAHNAAPRAWPSFMALSTLRLTNTRSMAISSGRYAAISRSTPSNIARSRVAMASPAAAMQPLAMWVWALPSQSMTPKPVRREPGSSPSTRTRAAVLNGTGWAAASGSNCRQELIQQNRALV